MAMRPAENNSSRGRPAVRRRASRPGEELRRSIQRFVRSFGLLTADQTPCGVALSPSYAHALMVLLDRQRRDEPASQQDLVKMLGIDKSNVARLCGKMIERNHVLQDDSPLDGRAWLVTLTNAGQRLAERVEEASRTRFDRLLSALPSDRARAAVIRSLDLLNDAIEATREMEATP